MKDSPPLNHLLAVLRERDIPLTRDDVKWAFQSPQTSAEVNSWVQKFLGPDTLLSKEEVELYDIPLTNSIALLPSFTHVA